MNQNYKTAAIGALLLILLLAFGCTATISDKSSFDAFNKLQEKYSAKDSLPTNTIKLNDYSTDLSLLAGKSGGSAQKVIQAEIYSVQTLLYLNKALEANTTIDYQNMRCSSTEVTTAISSIKLANDNYNKAVSTLSALASTEANYLRANQLQTVQGFGSSITQLQDFFEKKC